MGIRDEIERKYLLSGMPELPPATVTVHIEQGYIDVGELVMVDDDRTPDPEFPDRPDAPLRGRLRRERHPDGTVVCTNTVKRGRGLVRQELEQQITERQFEANWPRTAGARLTKTRHRVTDEGLTWEIDEFPELGVAVAEVELPSADVEPVVPGWLLPHIAREVTGELTYRNLMLARRAVHLHGRIGEANVD